MCRNIRVGIPLLVCLVLSALNFGCGGGRASQSSQGSQTPQSDGIVQAFQAPMFGFAFAPGVSEITTLNGIPGASAQGSPSTLPEGVTGIDFAPGQRSAMVARTEGVPVGVISFAGTNPGPLVPISGGISQAQIIAFSPNGSFAALYSASEGRLQVVAGLPETPQIIRDIGTGELPDTPQLLALADDGLTLLEGTEHSAVYVLSGSGPRLIENVSDLGGIVFNPKSTNALIFDRNGGTLSLLQNVGSAGSSSLLASGLTGLEGNIALQTSGRRAVITSTGANHLWEVDLRNLQTQDLQLPVPAAMLKPLRVSGDYLLSWQPGQLAWIVDTNQAKGSVYFVPAKAVRQSAQAQ